ncbi:MAG: undecaprenyl-diphosphate phosphatase, partial [Pseudomonadota bacterium]
GWADQGRSIDVAAHLGSLLAVFLYFRSETAQLAMGGIDSLRFRPTQNRKLFLLIAVASIPLVIVGAFFAMSGLADALRDPRIIGMASIGFGLLLWVADRKPTEIHAMPSTWKAGLLIGLAQTLALIPGTSRSGITITAGRWLRFSREESARFSMLLAIPAIGASGAYETLKLAQEGQQGDWTAAGLVAFFSFLAAWAAIALFMKMTTRMTFTPFVIYRVLLGLLLLAIFL